MLSYEIKRKKCRKVKGTSLAWGRSGLAVVHGKGFEPAV